MTTTPPEDCDAAEQLIWSRRKFLRTSASAALTSGALALPARAQGSPLDLTIYQVGDPHYMAFDTNNAYNGLIRSSLGKLAALSPSTPMPGAGTIGAAQLIINAGDLIESGPGEVDPATGIQLTKAATLERQWQNYVADFGLLGNEPGALVNLPVYECYGNHDQDGYLKQVSDAIGVRSGQLPNITARSGTFTYQGAWGNITVTNVHYAWKQGPIHFVQTNLRVGDGPERYPCSGSYTFLKNYLEGVVGASGAPVFVVVHLPPTTNQENEWPKVDRQKFYDLIRRFNTIGIIVGHTHSYGYYTWRGPDNDGTVPIQVYQCDSLHNSGATQGIFSVIRIVGNPTDPAKATIHVAQRRRNDTWGLAASKEFNLVYNPPNTDPPPPDDPLALNVLQWQSINLHNALACGLTITGNTFVEPRQAGIKHVEVLFDKTISLSNPTSAVTITGVRASGNVTPASLGISVTATVGATGKTLDIKFSPALPNAAKWRLTLNPAAISGAAGAVLSTSADISRVIAGLCGDFNGDGRVTALDLNHINYTTSFDPAIVNCLRADITGDAAISSADLSAAWANRNERTDILTLS
jgi:hypothetical protein